MKILGFMGSPSTKGLCAKFTDSALKGAESRGAEIKQYDLVKCNIKYCKGCHSCVYFKHELPIGKCPLKDDVAGLLEEYLQADGYIFSSPVFDMSVTAIMKTFLERRFALFYKDREDHGSIPDARVKQNFMKKAALISTGDAGGEYAEAMAEPCFEAMSAHFMLEEIDVVESLYIGKIHAVGEERHQQKLLETRQMGVRLVDEIEKSHAVKCL